MAYTYKNSKGQTYYLHSKEVTLKGGRKQVIYYFSRTEDPKFSLDAVPADRVVSENPRTGLPLLKKK
ncbi:hypothetical protein KGQ71_00020 [Patescibacteria group bacterium]|nr:hypothetical protein [Patescibacteria group bacterium]